jgi:hypothetical protein
MNTPSASKYDAQISPHLWRHDPVTECLQIPFNNDCINNNLATNLNVGGIGGIRLEVGRPSKEHIKKTLPPSIHCCQGKAEIKYYVKATVARPQFYKENFRGVCVSCLACCKPLLSLYYRLAVRRFQVSPDRTSEKVGCL